MKNPPTDVRNHPHITFEAFVHRPISGHHIPTPIHTVNVHILLYVFLVSNKHNVMFHHIHKARIVTYLHGGGEAIPGRAKWFVGRGRMDAMRAPATCRRQRLTFGVGASNHPSPRLRYNTLTLSGCRASRILCRISSAVGANPSDTDVMEPQLAQGCSPSNLPNSGQPN